MHAKNWIFDGTKKKIDATNQEKLGAWLEICKEGCFYRENFFEKILLSMLCTQRCFFGRKQLTEQNLREVIDN